MQKNQKIILGIFSFWPLIWSWGGGFAILISLSNENSFLFRHFSLFFTIQFLTILLLFGLIYRYISDIRKNATLDKDASTKWIAGLILAHIVAVPIYWYLHIWKNPNNTQKAVEILK